MKWTVPKTGFKGSFIEPTKCGDWGSSIAKQCDATFTGDNGDFTMKMTKMNIIDNTVKLRQFFRAHPFWGLMFFDQVQNGIGGMVRRYNCRCRREKNGYAIH